MRSGEAAGGEEPPTLQSDLEEEDADAGTPAPAAAPTIADPVALLRHLDVSGHFHRDGRMGRIYHAGMVSLREDVPTDSLHVSVDGNRVTAHVDEVSPLAVDPDGPSRYSVPRAVAHNLSGMARDLVLLVRGRQGDHRCELDCEWITAQGAGASAEIRLLDPATSAWSVQLEARVAGTLDEARLRRALAAATGSEAAQDDCLDVVACGDDDALDGARSWLYAIGVPVASTPPLRALLARHPAGDVLMLNLNHAATDGVGALRVLDAVARAYADPGAAGAPLEFLAGADLPVRPASAHTSIPARIYRFVLGRLRDGLAAPARLAADEPAQGGGVGFHLVGLTEEQSRAIAEAERDGAHHDVLLAALHLAIGDWNRRHEKPARRIGVLVPADLRPAEWRDEVIGNFSVNARMSTGRRHRTGPATALKAIASLGARNVRTRTGIALIAALERSGMLALWAKQSSIVLEPLTGNQRVDAALLCNLEARDEVPRFGPDAGAISELWFSIPARPPRCLCIGAVTVAGRLHLTFRYPRHVLGPDGARRFADCYLAHVRDVVAATRG
jgi:GNAT superfamily N-acetyltransferase